MKDLANNLSRQIPSAQMPVSPIPGVTLAILLHVCGEIDNHLMRHGTTGELAREFFQLLMEKTCIGHTVLGKKPVTEVALCLTNSPSSGDRLIDQNGWEAWQAMIRPPFVSSDLVMRKTNEQSKIQLPDGQTREYSRLLIYSRKNLELLCEQHGDSLDRALGQRINADSLIDLLNSDQGFLRHIKSNHELAGMLYGYGADNSRAFAEMMTFEAWPAADHFDPRRQAARQSNNLRQRSEMYLADQFLTSGEIATNGVPFRGVLQNEETIGLRQHYQENVTRMERLSRLGILAQTGIARWAGKLR